MNVFTLSNKLSSFLMLVLMVAALSMMTACSSTGDSDDAAADESATPEPTGEDEGACAGLPECSTLSEGDQPECEVQRTMFCGE